MTKEVKGMEKRYSVQPKKRNDGKNIKKLVLLYFLSNGMNL